MDVPKPRWSFRPGTMLRIGRVILDALDRQARAGLQPAKRGGMVDLHHVAEGELWSRVFVDEEGAIHFEHAQSWLLEKYGALDLRPDILADVERELTPILEQGIQIEAWE